MIDVIITACGRPDLLIQTLSTFLANNDYPINNIIIHEDHEKNQLIAIDKLMNKVETEMFLLLEDDWQCLQGGGIQEAIKILQENEMCLSVSLRGNSLTAHNGHPSKLINEVWHLSTDYAGWRGFSYAPSVRRTKDYRKYHEIAEWNKQKPYDAEKQVGEYYFKKAFWCATTEAQYFLHIGNGRHVK